MNDFDSSSSVSCEYEIPFFRISVEEFQSLSSGLISGVHKSQML